MVLPKSHSQRNTRLGGGWHVYLVISNTPACDDLEVLGIGDYVRGIGFSTGDRGNHVFCQKLFQAGFIGQPTGFVNFNNIARVT